MRSFAFRAFFLVLFTLMQGSMIAAPVFAQSYDADKTAEAAYQDVANDAKEAKENVKEEISEKTDSAIANIKETSSKLAEDIREARKALMGSDSGNDSPFSRGFLIALFQPIFLASMFCLGLWAGQMSARLSQIWMLPVFAYAGIVLGAFIATYHSDWMPQMDQGLLANFQSTDAVTLVVGLVIGAAVGMQLVLAPVLAILGVAAAGLWLGFSQTSELGAHGNAMIPFWSGFGLTGLLIGIFGIGFETFLESLKLEFLTRLVGVSTLLVSFFYVAKII